MDLTDPMLMDPSLVAAVGAALMAVGFWRLYRSRLPVPGRARSPHDAEPVPAHPDPG